MSQSPSLSLALVWLGVHRAVVQNPWNGCKAAIVFDDMAAKLHFQAPADSLRYRAHSSNREGDLKVRSYVPHRLSTRLGGKAVLRG